MNEAVENGNGKINSNGILEFFDSLSELERKDSTLSNVLTKMGTNDDWTEHITPNRRTYLSKRALEDLSTHPLINRICTAHADAATRQGWEINLGDTKKIKRQQQLNAEVKHLELANAFNEAQFLANVYGGAVIIQFIDDGKPADQPVDFHKIKRVGGYRVLDRHKIQPHIISYEDPTKVKHYQILLSDYLTQGLQDQEKFGARFKNGYLIHRSRVIRFDGTRCTPDMMLENDGWGQSLIEAIWDEFKLYKTALQSSGALLKDFSIFVIYWKGLLNLIDSKTDDEKEAFNKQLALFHKMISLFGGLFIDDEKQKLEFPSRNLTGVEQTSNLQRDAFIGVSGMPHTKIFGESPSGLGATGQSEERNWALEVGNFQVSRWDKKIRKATLPILKAKELNIIRLKEQDFNIKYHSILQLSEEEIVQNRATQAQTDSTYFNIGLPAKQILKDRFGGAKYSSETNFDEKEFDKEQQKQENQGGFGGFDFGDNSEIEIPQEAKPEVGETNKTDSADVTKRIVKIHGLAIGINNEIGETRFAGAKPLTVAYGHIRGSYGDGLDGMALDVYLGNYLDNPEIYKIRQLYPDTGEIDEDKYFIGFESLDHARSYFIKNLGQKRFGGISAIADELNIYKIRSPKISTKLDSKIKTRDTVDKITESYKNQSREITQDWVDQVSEWMETKSSLEEIAEGETEIFDLLAGDRFTQLIEESNIVSDLAGREEALNDE